MPTLLSLDAGRPDAALIARAAASIRHGRLVIYPTETFYALGGDPWNAAAVDMVFEAKGRPDTMALPLIAADREAVRRCTAEFPGAARRLAAAFWPGPLTLVLPASPDLPARLLGRGGTIGVRISPHPVAAALARAAGGLLIATSANRTGQTPPRTAVEAALAPGDTLDLILDGGPTIGAPASTVLDLSAGPPRLLRPGAVPIEAIERLLERRPE
ncbi:MAG: L-threonylcarbamoyladenylate synthase [Candidatus Polarisedimenticolia bacterium]